MNACPFSMLFVRRLAPWPQCWRPLVTSSAGPAPSAVVALLRSRRLNERPHNTRLQRLPPPPATTHRSLAVAASEDAPIDTAADSVLVVMRDARKFVASAATIRDDAVEVEARELLQRVLLVPLHSNWLRRTKSETATQHRARLLQWLCTAADLTYRAGVGGRQLTDARGFRKCVAALIAADNHGAALWHLLVTAGRTLLRAGVVPGGGDGGLLSLIANDLVWHARRLPVNHLLTVLVFSRKLSAAAAATTATSSSDANSGSGESKLDKRLSQLREACVDGLQRRWVEISSTETLIGLLAHHDVFARRFLWRLEDKTMDVAATCSSRETSRLLHQLANSGQRSLPVLRALAYHEARREQPIDMRDVARTLFALERLTFTDAHLLNRIEQSVCQQLADAAGPAAAAVQLTAVAAVTHAAGRLHWRCERLLDAVVAWSVQQAQAAPSDRLAYVSAMIVRTAAAVDYRPAQLPQLIQLMPVDVASETSTMTARHWLELVWARAVLQVGDGEQLRSVLNEAFATRLRREMSGAQSQTAAVQAGVYRKLLNVLAVAAMQPEESGPVVGGAWLEYARQAVILGQATQSKSTQSTAVALRQAVEKVLPTCNLYDATAADFGNLFCVRIDGEFVMRRLTATAVNAPEYDRLDKLVASALARVCGEKNACRPLPDDLVRVALCSWAFHDYTVSSDSGGSEPLTRHLTGANALSVRMLYSLGYWPLSVSHDELAAVSSSDDMARLLTDKMQQLAARDQYDAS